MVLPPNRVSLLVEASHDIQSTAVNETNIHAIGRSLPLTTDLKQREWLVQPQILNTTRRKPEFGSQIKLGQSERRIERSKGGIASLWQ